MNRFTDSRGGSGGGAPGIDVHQHVWPDGLVEALRGRDTAPCLRGWTLELPGQADEPIDPAWHEVDRRAAQARADGLGLALVSLSSPLGIESLAPDEAAGLLEAYHDGVLELPAPFGGWAAACLTEVDAAALVRELDRGFVGLQLPATVLLDAAGYELVDPLLGVLEERGRPLLVHPGPSGAVAPASPDWWPAIVSYVQQMHAAWFAFRVYGRPRYPRLRVCFALLAGLAPLHGERFAARAGDRMAGRAGDRSAGAGDRFAPGAGDRSAGAGDRSAGAGDRFAPGDGDLFAPGAGDRGAVDPDVFLEVSSYGIRAIDATVRVLGIDALVNGSDRPYAEPVDLDGALGAAAAHALRRVNPLRLLNHKEVSHESAVAAGS
jgi:6-methylsalicylate decarboxylase